MSADPAGKRLLTKAECRRLGLSRPDVDRMFDRVPLVVLPESRKVYVRHETMEEWLDRHTMSAPRPDVMG